MQPRPAILSILAAALFLAGCGASDNPTITGQPVGSQQAAAPSGGPSGGVASGGSAGGSGGGSFLGGLLGGGGGNYTEGTDYMVVSRVRFNDEMGFDRPVEAFSMLFPKGWRTEGGVKWGSVQGCRAELIRSYVKATSPDGAYEFAALPLRGFTYASDRMMLQAMAAGAQAGGCQISQAFNAKQFVEGYARRELHAEPSNVRPDEARMALMAAIDQKSNQTAQQFGNDLRQQTEVAYADLKFPDGSIGVLNGTVVNMGLQRPDMLNGGVTTSTTTVVVPFMMRCPAGKNEECLKLFNMLMASHRNNPVWEQAKNQFMQKLGSIEHAASMERIRLMGEQSRAYAKAASDASDQRMRDWESRQAAQDAGHRKFIQSIREVESWKDSGGGSVELQSGYSQAWSRGDGTYVLTNKADFDPNRAFREQQWTQMQREQ